MFAARVASVAAVALAAVLAVSATAGVDVVNSVSLTQWQCLAGQGVEWTAVRSLNATGQPNTFAPGNVRRAWNGGIKGVDLVFDPCVQCKVGVAEELAELAAYLKQEGVEHNAGSAEFGFGTVWLEVKDFMKWGVDVDTNLQRIQAMMTAADNLGWDIGILSTYDDWTLIMDNKDVASQYDLWYIGYDDQPNFNDFRAFGGWDTPALKQYPGKASATVCGILNVNADYFDNSQ